MTKVNAIQLFEEKNVRTIWDAEQEKWFISIIDVINILTESTNARKYWSVLKVRLKKEGSQLATNCSQLKMQSSDGKFYKTDVADTEQLFRLIQSIPSPKAEPFKLWLAQIASERLDEMQDPELSIDRALEQYLQLGYSENWINQRLKSIEIRKELTDEWKGRGMKEGQQFATLTDIISKSWSGNTTKEYKVLKGLKKENLRDNMTNTELILNMLAEASTKDISQAVNPETFEENKKVAKQGGNVAKVALKELEAKTGKKVVSALNAKSLKEANNQIDKSMSEVLLKYLPEHAVESCFELIKINSVHLKIVNERQTRHGDYRKGLSGKHEITVNSNLNKYRFLITLVHEISHLVAFDNFGRNIKPHGVEWKMTFQRLMVPFIRPEIFPHSVLPLVAQHFRNPTASSDTDAKLAFALKQFDERKPDVHFIHEVPSGSMFRIKNGRIFQKNGLRTKRYECVEVHTGRLFLFNANAEVEIIPG